MELKRPASGLSLSSRSRGSSRPSTGGSIRSHNMDMDTMSMDRSVTDSLRLVTEMRREQLRHVQYMRHNEETSHEQQEYAKSMFDRSVQETEVKPQQRQRPHTAAAAFERSKTKLSAYLTLSEMCKSSVEAPRRECPSSPTARGSALYNPRIHLLNQIRLRQPKRNVIFYHDRIEQEIIQEGGSLPSKTASFPFKWSDVYVYTPYPKPKIEDILEEYRILQAIELANKRTASSHAETDVEKDSRFENLEVVDDQEEPAEIEQIPFNPPPQLIFPVELQKESCPAEPLIKRESSLDRPLENSPRRNSRRGSRRGSRMSDNSRKGSRCPKSPMSVSSVGSEDLRNISSELQELETMVNIVRLDTEKKRKAAEEEYLRLHPPPPPSPPPEPEPEPAPPVVDTRPVSAARRGNKGRASSRTKSPKSPRSPRSPKSSKSPRGEAPKSAKQPSSPKSRRKSPKGRPRRSTKTPPPAPEPVLEAVAEVEEAPQPPEPTLEDIWPVFEGPVIPSLPEFPCPSSEEKSRVFLTRDWWGRSPLTTNGRMALPLV